MPAISIIIPMYNVEKYLRRCLDSVKNQTFTDWTAICVDDGSPDNSGKIAEEYAARDKRFIVVHKENGGLSDARNFGMKYATGDYIMYLDSDDFIHPQTMEIAYALALRDKSDIVSFRYDRKYRPRLMVRHVLHLDTDNVVPRAMKKHYDVAKIETRITSDVFEYATERTHNFISCPCKSRWLIKHCQVWKNMYRRELITDIPFIKGILFEDFPWWSAVMLKKPIVTITRLPLYFYIPNFGGIVLSAKQLKIMQSLCAGIKASFLMYQKKATAYQTDMWAHKFKWYFVKWAFRKVRYFDTESALNDARKMLHELAQIGVLDDAVLNWEKKLRNDIRKFLNSDMRQ